ncbi:MAG: (2Fe-2S)-binding protein [Pseudomonadota bacterium]|uniref:(2Fe-2S)-binding protein n=1 Tax=Thermithiobacillus tepidarius TaxID=929 RepID=UPI00040BCF18|nr:(2Fe-2S)-binding protein [Thermithiobacillus tepidarius]
MYVCLCHAVTDRDIKQAVENGACTMRHLRDELKVATQCGRCAQCAKGCLNQALAERVCSENEAA